MSLVTEIEQLTSPSPMLDMEVAALFGKPMIKGVAKACRCITRDCSHQGVSRALPYTASYDAVESLIIGGHFLGHVGFTTDTEGKPLVTANFRGKSGRGHNLACAMLAAIIRFYLPEQG